MEISQEIVRELLYYDYETGAFTWRERDRSWFKSDQSFRRWNIRFRGRRAGKEWVDPRSGYRRREIFILGSWRKEHRLAWLYVLGAPLPSQIDHGDRDATNNAWCNLRAVTPSENMRNRTRNRNNTSGVTGVNWHKKHAKWHARSMSNGKLKHIGYFDDLGEAERAVRLFRASAGYHCDHGSGKIHSHK